MSSNNNHAKDTTKIDGEKQINRNSTKTIITVANEDKVNGNVDQKRDQAQKETPQNEQREPTEQPKYNSKLVCQNCG